MRYGAATVVLLLWVGRAVNAQLGVTDSPVLILKAPNFNRSISFSADGKYLLTVREHFKDKKVCIFSLPEGQLVREFGHTTANIQCAAFSPDARFIVYGGDDRKVRIADAQTGAQVAELDAREPVKSVAWSGDGRFVLSGGNLKRMMVWEAGSFAPRFEAQPHFEVITAVAASPDGRFAASCGEDKRIIVMDLQRGAPVVTLEHLDDESKFASVAFSGNGRFLCAGDEEGRFRVWRVPEFTPLGNFPKENENDILAVALSPDGRFGASGGRDHKFVVWDIEGGRALHKREAKSDVHALAFSPDGKFLAVGTNDKGVQLFGLTGVSPGSVPQVAAPAIPTVTMPPAAPAVAASPKSKPPGEAPGKKESLAVVDFDLRGKLKTTEPDAGRTIASLIVSRIDATRYEIYERGQLVQLLEEQKLQMTEIADNADKAIKFGKLKGIRFIVLGSVDQLGDTFFITARLVDCETGRVGLKADATANNLNLLGPAIDQLLAKMGVGG